MATHGCGRGVFGLKDWDPQKRAGYLGHGIAASSVTQQQRSVGRTEPQEPASMSNGRITADIRDPGYKAQSSSQPAAPRPSQVSGNERQMLAKYSYKANPDSPLGRELTVKQGEKLFLVEKHENEHWWLGRNADGEVGLVPSSYMMLQEEKVSQLPWLQNRSLETEQPASSGFGAPEKVEFKPYQSAYNRTTQAENEYRCKICERSFNGPIPYQAHMSSKAHREELEAQGLL